MPFRSDLPHSTTSSHTVKHSKFSSWRSGSCSIPGKIGPAPQHRGKSDNLNSSCFSAPSPDSLTPSPSFLPTSPPHNSAPASLPHWVSPCHSHSFHLLQEPPKGKLMLRLTMFVNHLSSIINFHESFKDS